MLAITPIFKSHWIYYSPEVRTVLECSAAIGISYLMQAFALPTMILLTGGTITATLAVITGSSTLHHLSRIVNRTALASIIGALTIHTLIHEGGHAFMAGLLYRNPEIAITLNSLGEGSTSYLASGQLT